jgi:hypothetical protein
MLKTVALLVSSLIVAVPFFVDNSWESGEKPIVEKSFGRELKWGPEEFDEDARKWMNVVTFRLYAADGSFVEVDADYWQDANVGDTHKSDEWMK